jgi:Fe-S cluster assembly protein SufD
MGEALAHDGRGLEEHLTRVAGPDQNVFADLNAAFVEDGACVFIEPGRREAAPIHLVFLSTNPAGDPTVSHPRVLVVAGRGSQAQIVESYGGPDGEACFTNAVTEVVVGDGAVLGHTKLQREGLSAFHVATLAATLGRDARFSSHAISLGGALVRNDINVVFDAEGGECVLNGLFMATGTQHVDNHTRIDHAKPHGSSRELYKGILDGRARGVFDGKILVRRGAQKTDAHQTNRNLLLSKEALVDSTPALEILADDVKCKHGSTTGQLDAAALFYLRSRGIGEAAARSLLTYAFASDVVRQIPVEAIRASLDRHLRSQLGGLG